MITPRSILALAFILCLSLVIPLGKVMSVNSDAALLPNSCLSSKDNQPLDPDCLEGIKSGEAVSYRDISSNGPLSHIYTGIDASVQVAHTLDGTIHEFYPRSIIPGDAGTFLVVDNTLYAPHFASHGGTATGSLGTYQNFTTVSQTAVQGTGSSADPYRVVTIVDAGNTGVRIIQTDTYVVGSEAYRTDIQLSNSGSGAKNVILYRAADCYLGTSDFGYGMMESGVGSVACTKNANNNPNGRILQYVPLTGGSQRYEAGYAQVWVWIASKQPFPNTCRCNELIDNGMGLSWNVALAAGGQSTVSHMTTFSPLGSLPVTLQKSADSSQSTPGATNGYTITINNPNQSAVVLTSITDRLPEGFTHVPNSTSGVTSSDPSVNGRELTWTGQFSINAASSNTLHFNVQVSGSPGQYVNDVRGVATGFPVSSAIGVAPITVSVDVHPISIDFQLDEDGYKFQNIEVSGPGHLDYTQDDMVLMFGQEQTCAYTIGPVCVLKFDAIKWHQSISWKVLGGRCYGMTVSALRFFTDIDQPADFEDGETEVYGLDKGNARGNITWHHILQFLAPMNLHPLYTPNDVLQRVYQSLQSGYLQLDNLYLYAPNKKSGHSVLPYAIEDAGDGKWRIKVYDNNTPNDSSRYILIDTIANRFSTNLAGSMGSWTGDADDFLIGVEPLSKMLQTPQCPWCENSQLRDGIPILTALSHGTEGLLVTDENGRRAGHIGGVFVNEIPDATVAPPINGLGIPEDPDFYLPATGEYTFEFSGDEARATTDTDLSVFGPGFTAAVSNMALDNSSQDKMIVSMEEHQIAYVSSQPKQVDLWLTGGQAGNEQYRVLNADIGAAEQISVRQTNGDDQIVISYQNAGDGQYSLELARLTASGEEIFLHNDIAIEAGDSHVVRLDTLAEESVELCTDDNSDGTVDDCQTLDDESEQPGTSNLFLPAVFANFGTPAFQPLVNGDFEQGPSVGWQEYSSNGWAIVTHVDGLPNTLPSPSGQWAAWLGGDHNEISYIQQQVTVPTDRPYLTYSHFLASEDYCGYDFAGTLINGTVVDVYDLCSPTNSTIWSRHSVDLSAYRGQTVALQIRVETDSSLFSSLYVDDVGFSAGPAVAQAQPAAPQSPPDGLSKRDWGAPQGSPGPAAPRRLR